MQAFKHKNVKKIVVSKKNITTLDGKHKEIIDGFTVDKEEQMPLLLNEKREICMKLKNVNLGNYSPTRVVVAQSLEETFRIMDKDSFAPMDEAIVFKQLETGFVRSGKTKLLVEGGDLRVVAESPGKSMIILPIEYSHCLKFKSNNENSNLRDFFRVDAILTGLIFENELDVTTKFRYGVFKNNNCRLKDLADFKSLSED